MSQPTVLATSRRSRIVTFCALPLLGLLAGGAVLAWHDDVLAWTWLPGRGLFELVDGRHLVLVAHNGTDLARVRTELDRSRLAAAFRAHGYPWTGP